MLLIGSRAAKYHFPFYRKPKDYDFVAYKPEVEDFLSNFNYKDISTHDKKIRAKVDLDKPTIFEFELAEKIPSSNELYYMSGTYFKDTNLNLTYKVASPENLFLIKKSHICFNIHWKKNIADYLFLKSRLDETKFDNNWHSVFNQRFQETKNRVKFKDRNFDVDNSEFFKISEKAVNRVIHHDNLHLATCFFSHPIFMDVKDDLSKAAMNPAKVAALSHELKIKLIQEECMALALERYILPCVRDKKEFNARHAYMDTACRMVYNYLPMFLKFFAADHFLEILNLKIDYVKKFFENVKGLNLPDENIQFAKTTIGLL